MLKPFTVIKDWDMEVWDQEFEVDEDPQMFHVWARSGADASDEANDQAVKKWGEKAADYLHFVAVLQGHALFAED